jgi:hypothetical protein
MPQPLAGLVHECSRGVDVRSGKTSMALDDVTADDHGIDIGWSGVEHHDCNRVPESVKVRRP